MGVKAITMGDPCGIGPEVSLKALMTSQSQRESTLIIGSRAVLSYYSDLMNNTVPLAFIDEPEQFENGKINIISEMDMDMSKLEIGKVSAEGGDAAYRYVEKAIHLAMEKRIDAVITGPLNKEALHKGGHNYEGHTEIFGDLTQTDKFTMMLWSETLSVVHVSTHISIREACDRVKKERIIDCIKLANDALEKMGVEKPKIAVAGLNPHSGEGGLFGSEDKEEIHPAVTLASEEGYLVFGPLPPDTVFLKASEGEYDCVVAMYHDQGHIPMKLLAFDSGVNITLGLPIIRTSVDHGTAFDIAGKGIASEESILAALDIGARLA